MACSKNSIMGRGREREDGGQGSQGGSEHNTYPASFQVGRAMTSFQEKGLVSALNKIRWVPRWHQWAFQVAPVGKNHLPVQET